MEQWLKRMIKGSPSAPKPKLTPSGPVKNGKASTSKIPVSKATPSTSRRDSDLTTRLEAIRERRKTLEEHYSERPWVKAKAKVKVLVLSKTKALEKWNSSNPYPGGKIAHEAKSYDDAWITTVTEKMTTKKKPTKRRTTRRKRTQRGWGVDIQKWLAKTGIEFHWPGYQYMGPGTKLANRLKRGDPGINRSDKIAKQHDINYSHAQNLQDKWKADAKMIKAIDRLPGEKTMTERVVKRIMQAKKRLKL